MRFYLEERYNFEALTLLYLSSSSSSWLYRERSFWYHLHPSCTEGSLSLHSLSDNTCPVPNCSFGSESPCAHFLSAHTDLNISVDVFVEACIYCSDSLFMYGKFLYHLLQINMESLVSPPLFSFHVYFPVNPEQ